MQANTSASHLGDSELLRLVDRDASGWEMDVWGKHVLACDVCASRLSLLQQDAARVSDRLSELPLPAGFPTAVETVAAARTRRHPVAASWRQLQPGLRAAAVVVILLLPFVVSSPLRAMVVDWMERQWEQAIGLLGEGRIEEPGIPTAATESGATVWFTTSAPELQITIKERQRSGELVLMTAETSEGSLELVGAEAESTVVTETGIEILNQPRSTASYRLALPAGVDRVRLRIADEPARTLSRSEWQTGRAFELDHDRLE